MAQTDVPIDLYIAAYADPHAAQADWDDIKALARDDVITVDALVLVSRDAHDGKVHVKDNAHDVGKGAALGAVGGLLVGLIFPPSLLASAVVGGGVGAGAGAILDHEQKKAIKADVEDVLAIPYGVTKAPAVLAAVRSGLVSSLVTHDAMARVLLDGSAAAGSRRNAG